MESRPTLTEHSQQEDQAVSESTGHRPSYAMVLSKKKLNALSKQAASIFSHKQCLILGECLAKEVFQ